MALKYFSIFAFRNKIQNSYRLNLFKAADFGTSAINAR